MIFDCHSHTKFSADSKMLAQDAIARAEALNIGIIFTEHYDYNLPGDVDFTFDAASYIAEYKNFRSDKVKLGVEIGLLEPARELNKNFIAQANFDLVIGSIHVVDDTDLYDKTFYADKDKMTAYRKYFAAMAEEISDADFDVLGHIDYICRAATYENPEIDYATFKTEIDAVLKIIVERNKILELNTRRLDTVRGLKELVPVYTQYKNFGGKYITIGSDAHKTAAIGAHFDKVLDFAKEIGLTPVHFNQRKIEFD